MVLILHQWLRDIEPQIHLRGLIDVPNDLRLACGLSCGIEAIRVGRVCHHEVVVTIPVPLGVGEDIDLGEEVILAVDLCLLCEQLHPQLDLVSALLAAEELPLEVLGDLVGALNGVFGLIAGHVGSVGLLQKAVGDLVEV